MISRVECIIILSVFCMSCGDKDSSKDLVKETRPPVNLWIEKFSLPFNQTLETDSTSFIFYKSKSFDTSFAVQLQKRDSIIKGVYYQVLPSYHRNMEDYLNKHDQLLAFEGLSFKIDLAMWQAITNNCKKKLFNAKSLPNNNACLDCPAYFVSFDGKKIVSDDGNRALFNEYVNFLKDTLVNRLIEKRKPRLTLEH